MILKRNSPKCFPRVYQPIKHLAFETITDDYGQLHEVLKQDLR